MSHYYPEDQSKENLDKVRRESVCVECGRRLTIYLDIESHRRFVACPGRVHEGITREYKPPVEDYESNIRREMKLAEEEVMTTKETNALVAQGIPMTGLITKDQATAILQTVWKDAPEIEVYKAAMLCQDFGLHPLMKHVYLIPYNEGKPNETWATVLGIGATRLIMSRLGSFGYTDDTPRIMSEEEQVRIFGKMDSQNIVAITKLKTKDGLEASGYGKYPKTGGTIIGENKGNSRENLAFIRSERNAFGRLFPDANMPKATIDVVDEKYMETPSGLVEVATGEITGVGDKKTPPTVKTEIPAIVQEEPQPFDKDWCVEQIKMLGEDDPDWSREVILKRLNKLSGKNATSITHAISLLDEEQGAFFVKGIEVALKVKGG